jgi:translation initiation factor IF-2
MGHVDHGKTSLLDAIRHANVTASEAGGITQHIGAYRVKLGDRDVTFLDTPGHAAFTTMRARGAQVTDIAVLVVAADDGIMPQTIEAIHHAKAANVSIIVAINKMDKPGANPQHVMEQLTEYGLVAEEWGGETPCIPVSAVTKEGIKDLLEMIILTADMKELKANPDRAAKGTVVEARLDKGRGPIATMLVQNGTLRTGDIIVAGTSVGRVRAMTDENGNKIEEAGPSVPVEITGLDDVPTGGDIFNAVSDERLARELVDQRRSDEKEEMFNSRTKVTLDNLFEQMQQGEMKELQLIVKADVQGSVEAVRQSLEKLSNEEVRVNVIHGGVGAISESDVMLASASNAIIVGFNVRPDPLAEETAKRDGVDLRLYRIIYDCIGEIESAMKGMLAPKFREVPLGKAECREVYKITNVGIIVGSHITTGKITRGAQVRIVRDGIVITEDKIVSIRRFKDDVKEVAEGYDCGIGLDRFNDVKVGDILEAFVMEEYRD